MAEDQDAREPARLAQEALEAAGGAALARELLAKEGVAVLATQSLRDPGYPSTSLVPYALSADGEPLLLLSALAQHTQNLAAEPRASLLVFDGAAAAADPRTAPRLALRGEVVLVPPAEKADARTRYLERHPRARGLFALDFALRVLRVEDAQLVGGFGAAGFLSGAELRGPSR